MSSGRGNELRVQAPQCAAPFVVHAERPRTLLIGDGVGIGSVVFLAERLRGSFPAAPAATAAVGYWKPLVLLGSEIPFPFRTRPSTVLVSGIPTGSIACMPLLEEWGVPSRLASKSDFPGCFDGWVTELADAWLGSLGPAELAEVEIFSCGPTSMLDATGELARRYAVPCQSVSVVPPAVDAHTEPRR